MELKGIDVSAYNTVTSYERVAGSGVKAAILRITEQGNVADPTFEANYRGFRRNGIKTGAYKFSYALSENQAAEEAKKVLEILNGRELDFPVFYDLEWKQQRALPKAEITRIAKAFRSEIVNGGYRFGIYCNMDWYYNVLDTESLPYDYWLAAYPYNDRGQIVESLRPPVGIGWQYSSKGEVPGISGYVDMNVFYKDYSVEKPGENGSGGGQGESAGEGSTGGGVSGKPAQEKEYISYKVKAGETLSAIAKKYDTTVTEIARLNKIKDVNLIQTGQKLKIPVKKKYRKWVGECTGNSVNVRKGPGLAYSLISDFPYLNKGNLVDVIGEKKSTDDILWYHIRIAKAHKGYIRHDFIKKV